MKKSLHFLLILPCHSHSHSSTTHPPQHHRRPAAASTTAGQRQPTASSSSSTTTGCSPSSRQQLRPHPPPAAELLCAASRGGFVWSSTFLLSHLCKPSLLPPFWFLFLIKIYQVYEFCVTFIESFVGKILIDELNMFMT